jgi:hypothetical protein
MGLLMADCLHRSWSTPTSGKQSKPP